MLTSIKRAMVVTALAALWAACSTGTEPEPLEGEFALVALEGEQLPVALGAVVGGCLPAPGSSTGECTPSVTECDVLLSEGYLVLSEERRFEIGWVRTNSCSKAVIQRADGAGHFEVSAGDSITLVRHTPFGPEVQLRGVVSDRFVDVTWNGQVYRFDSHQPPGPRRPLGN